MIKKILLPAAMLFSLSVAVAQPQSVMLDKIVAVVGSSSILYSEVQQHAAEIVAQRQQRGYTSDRDPKSEALETLMEQKLLYNQGMLDSVSVNSVDVSMRAEDYLSSLISQAGGVAALEREQNMAIFNIRENIRQRYEEQMYAQAMQGEIVGKVTVVPGDVDQFYKNKDKDSLPTIGEQYVYAQITKKPSSIDNAKLRVRERLLDMRERIISGKTRFDALARMYSVDPGSAYRGGEMEPQPLSGFVTPFADALAALQQDQVSEIVETEFGFHIIQLIDRKGNLYHARHILLRPVYAQDELDEPTKFLDSLVGQIRKDSITFEKAAMLHSDDAHSKMNGGIVSNQDLLERYNAFDAKLTVTKFLKEDFGNRGYKSIDDYMALRNLKPGEVSDAFSTQDMIGDQLSKIVKLVEVIPAHVASPNEDYLRLEQMTLEQKQERVFDEWLRKKIDGMYVFVDPSIDTSDFENKNWIK